MIDTINGANSPAILYCITETAKANDLKTYDYVEYLLEEIPKHMDESSLEFLDNLMPWSESLPSHIRKLQKKSETLYQSRFSFDQVPSFEHLHRFSVY